MKTLILIAMLATAVTADFYHSKFDDFDINPILENEMVALAYGMCFHGRGFCSPEAEELKRILPEAFHTNCKKCTPKQRQLLKQVITTALAQERGRLLYIPAPYRDYMYKFSQEL